jgi:glutamine amidotransferase
MRALVLHYGVGNIYSIKGGLQRAGFQVEVSNEIRSDVDLIVFPGVGSFSAVAKFLEERRQAIEEAKEKGVKFLGVCLGMQVMFEKGTEGGLNNGLGWYEGIVDRIKGEVKLPHIGWDLVKDLGWCELTEGLDGKYVYYVHSYVAYTPERPAAVSFYGVEYPAVVCNDFSVGTQFHPEKSSKAGEVFLYNLARWVRR